MTYGKKIFIANVGDSRAVVLRVKNEGKNKYKKLNFSIVLTTDPITRDHKPDDKEEAERIFKHEGRIDTYRDAYNN